MKRISKHVECFIRVFTFLLWLEMKNRVLVPWFLNSAFNHFPKIIPRYSKTLPNHYLERNTPNGEEYYKDENLAGILPLLQKSHPLEPGRPREVVSLPCDSVAHGGGCVLESGRTDPEAQHSSLSSYGALDKFLDLDSYINLVCKKRHTDGNCKSNSNSSSLPVSAPFAMRFYSCSPPEVESVSQDLDPAGSFRSSLKRSWMIFPFLSEPCHLHDNKPRLAC